DQAEGTSVSYDAVNNIPYQLNGCSAVSLGAITASPHYPSGSVTLTATATCPGTPTYNFWTKTPTGTWTMDQDYSTTNTFGWSDTGRTGSYNIEVDVRDQAETVSYDTVKNLPYQLIGCSAVSLSADKTSPQPHGATVTFTATATCPGTPTYKF